MAKKRQRLAVAQEVSNIRSPWESSYCAFLPLDPCDAALAEMPPGIQSSPPRSLPRRVYLLPGGCFDQLTT